LLYTRRSLAVAASLVLCSAVVTQSRSDSPLAPRPSPLKEEVRGVWVVRTDMTSPQAVSRAVRVAERNGLNTLFVQCRGRGDAYYASELEPRAQALAKAPLEFDPLAQAVAEGHAAGLKVHAWVNACYVWSDKNPPVSADHMIHAHKDWLAVDRNGRRCVAGDPEVFICPSNPEARAHLVAVCRDVASRYEVDGIQLDYIRYAKPNLCYCAGCLKRFEAHVTPKVPAAKLAAAKRKGRLGVVQSFGYSWGQFRREQITSLVGEIRASVKRARPEICLSAAVIPWGACPADFRESEAYKSVAQDWYGWIKSGLVDAVCPMTYQVGLPGFRSWVDGVNRCHPDFPVWYGIGAYLFSPDSAAAKVKAVRGSGGRGWVLFSYTAVTRGGTDDAYLRKLKARVLPEQRISRTDAASSLSQAAK